MKYYIIETKQITYIDIHGNSCGYKPSKIFCIVENEEVAKDFCNKHTDYTYSEVVICKNS